MFHDRPWLFDLARFDEDPQPPDDDPGNLDPEPDPEPETDDTPELGDKGKQALDRMKADRAKARKEAAEAKRRADELAAKVAEFEDRDKSETEKLAKRTEQAEARARQATERAVRAEVKALAADVFADPEDAHAFLDLATYAGDGGEIDVESIRADLDDLLERKPHLRKQAAVPLKKTPKPDPSQGPRKEPEPTDYRTADKAAFVAELQKLGVRPTR
ncbi:hypothetical protein ABT294_00630 [Nonomuraea sp. NPDC000554]|uniref:hypothetical protein n=1 Tax=Nonomuraea sp. NPDC000554 TaxID=3154259 RepID=UPI0033260534